MPPDPDTAARHAALVDVSPHGMVEADPVTRTFTWFNRRMHTMFGYSAEEFAQLSIADLHPADALDTVAAAFDRLSSGDLGSVRAIPCRRRDGSRFVCDIEPGLFEVAGEIRLLAYFTDVTVLHELTDRLVEAHRLARLGSWTLDHTTGRLEWSDEVYRIFRLGPAEFSATYEAFLSLVHPDDAEAVDRVYGASLTDRTPYDLVHRVLHLDGSISWVHERAAHRYDAEGRPVHSVGTVQDITERRKADERARAGAALESLGRVTGELAHDVNNLLHVISSSIESSVELVADELGPERSRSIADPLELALAACRRGGDLTARLLAVARRQPLTPVDVDLAEEIRALQPLAETVVGRSVRVEIVAPDEPIVVQVDLNGFGTAILNLLTNARDALTGTGSVRLEAARAEASTEPGLAPGTYARVSVIDDGVGISADHLQRVFEPFWTSKSFGAGTGLGLAMVHGFATQSGGTATVESTPGRGTAVSIWLPSARSLTGR